MRGVNKEYSNGEVTVVWKNERCIHSGHCVRGLPSVFSNHSSPWVNVQGATTQEMIDQVEKCPSGALTYYLNSINENLEKNRDAPGKSVVDNTERRRFEMNLNGEYAYVDYRYYKDDIALMHTFVPEAERNKGIATTLIRFALENIKARRLKLMVYCPSVAKYIKLHPEYEPLVDQQYRQLK
jgi:uncharacterized Fe-S cluster protein YjdI/predicted GNAT family acetyltransferase